MDRKALVNATAIGTAAQLVMVVAGHFAPVVSHAFAIGGMLISLLAGLLFVRLAWGGWGPSLIGGAIAGGVGALIGIAVSAALGDVPMMLVVFGTCASVVAGIVGAALGRLVVKSA